MSEMDRAVAFYSALTFQKVSDREVLGEEFEHLEGVFGARMRIVRMQLGDEHIDLIEYLRHAGDRFLWIRAVTICGFNTLPLLYAIWTRHLRNCVS